MIVWTAGHNMPGYLPESEPATFRTRLDALEFTIGELERAADGMWDVDDEEARAFAADYEDATVRLRAHDADVDGDWYETFEDGRYAYWFQSVDMPEAEAEAALAGDA